MKIKQIRNIVFLSSLVLFTACVDQNSINVKKEKEMREEATLDISKMPIQTYEEYIELKRFVLEKYIENQNAKKRGIAYLNDGTRIKYSLNKRNFSERILSLRKPFGEVLKLYYLDNKVVQDYMEFIANLEIGTTRVYNKHGEIAKVYDNEAEYRSKGLNYKKLLEGAEKQGFINLEEGKLLKGDSFKIYIEEDTTPMTREEKEEFAKEVDLSYTVIDDFIKDKYFWRFDIEYSDRTEMHTFTRDGVYIGHFASSRRMRY